MQALEVTHRTGDYYGDGISHLVWEITDASGVAAELYVSTDKHEIVNVEVRKDRRREGLARALYVAATQTVDIYHAPTAHRTLEGNAFANAVGGLVVDAYECDCFGCAPIED